MECCDIFIVSVDLGAVCAEWVALTFEKDTEGITCGAPSKDYSK